MADDTNAAVEWGGVVWSRQVCRALDWLGDLAGLSVLEIGTRKGGMAVHFARLGAARVVGLDVDEEPLRTARALAKSAGVVDQVEFRTYSGNPADLPAGFDVVFTKSTLVLMSPLDETFAAIGRSLSTGGRLVAIENARGPWPIHLARLIRRRSLRPHGAAYFTRRTVKLARDHLDVRIVRWTVVPPTVLICAEKRLTRPPGRTVDPSDGVSVGSGP